MKEVIRKYAGSQREASFDLIDQLLPLTVGSVIETGCIRRWPNTPDGASTVILAQLAKDHKRLGVSIDINKDHINKADQALRELELDLDFKMYISNSISLLRTFNSIGVLYLDSFDYQPNNPIRSQRHAMAELGAAWGGLSDKCIIGIDDWNDKDGGKGGLVIPYLLDNGFKMAHEGYIRVLTRGI